MAKEFAISTAIEAVEIINKFFKKKNGIFSEIWRKSPKTVIKYITLALGTSKPLC
jgi:hypothetical protein